MFSSPGRLFLEKSATTGLPNLDMACREYNLRGRVISLLGEAASTGGVKKWRRKTKVRLASGCPLAHTEHALVDGD